MIGLFPLLFERLRLLNTNLHGADSVRLGLPRRVELHSSRSQFARKLVRSLPLLIQQQVLVEPLRLGSCLSRI